MTFSTTKKIALMGIFCAAECAKGIRLSALGKRARAAEVKCAAQAGEEDELRELQQADGKFFDFLTTDLDKPLDFQRGLGPRVNVLPRPALRQQRARGSLALNHWHQDGSLDPPELRQQQGTGALAGTLALNHWHQQPFVWERPELRRQTATGKATEQQRRMRHLQLLMQQVEHSMRKQGMEGSLRDTPTLSVEAGAGSSLSPSNGSRARSVAAGTNERVAKRQREE